MFLLRAWVVSRKYRLILKPSQQTQNICITFKQYGTNVEDVGPTLYKCDTYIECLLGFASDNDTVITFDLHLSFDKKTIYF